MGYRVAVVGATGNVGREVLNIFAERKFPADEVIALASSRSIGREISYGDKILKAKNLEDFDFKGVDFAIMSAGGSISRDWAPRIAASGCIVIDNSSYWRYNSDVPLVVPEVNGAILDRWLAKIKRVVVSTYQSVSGAGKEGVDELWNQTKGIFVNDTATPGKFPKQIAFNVIPHIDVFMEDGYTKEEWKVLAETKKILDPKIKVTCTAVRVPVFVGHSEAVNIEFENPLSADEARDILREAPGITVIDKREPGGYATPVESVGEYDTFVSRIREDNTVENGLVMWVVSDNLRKGAALNTIQIAEELIARGLKARLAA
jgi:aspartate-semialdehyde dehydrogenase